MYYADDQQLYLRATVPLGRIYFNDNTADAFDRVEVLEGPEIEIGPYDDEEAKEVTDWECPTSSDVVGSDMSESDGRHQPLGLGPESNIYEVDMILDGPRKRKEHNFMVCYKIRWKNFGAEADSWQPLSDLENVMYMVDEYNQEKRAQRKKRRKNEKVEAVASSDKEPCADNVDLESSSSSLSAMKDNGGTSSQDEPFNPLFGHLKDRFWKKLEMGLLDEQVFEGDMYSKVKGSRRAAHADAALNIKKIQTTQQKTPPPMTERSKSSSPYSLSSSLKRNQRKGFSNTSTSLKTLSPVRTHIGSRMSGLGSATKNRKRSSDPFSARGYMSAKRSRRSREHKRSSPSVTSVTVGIVSLDSEGKSIDGSMLDDLKEAKKLGTTGNDTDDNKVQESCSDHRMESRPDASYIADKSAETPLRDEIKNEKQGAEVMTVTSETMLTVTTSHKRLEQEVIQPEDIFKMKHDDWFLPDSTSLSDNNVKHDEVMAAAAEPEDVSAASGATQWPMKSPLEAIAEASGAVEKSYRDLVWGGACNRSDSKSNRRWNMKNGKDEQIKKKSNKDSDDKTILTTSPQCASPSTSVTISLKPSTTSPSKKTTSPVSSHQGKKSNLANMRSLEYDSSFDDSGPSSMEKDAMSSGVMDALAHRMHVDTIASSNTCKTSIMANCSLPPEGSSISQSSVGSNSNSNINVKRGDNTVSERPGIFSDNNCAFNFIREATAPSASIHNSPAPSTNSSSNSPGSINLSSPGKENFRSSNTNRSQVTNTDSNNPLPSSNTYGAQSSTNSNVQEPVSSSSSVLAGHHSTEYSPSSSDAWSPHRKRTNDLLGPLEKIPSPNSRRGSDLDRRIASITCDELEDMDIQGEDRFVKTGGFISNADLLQAVNLSKAEVVGRAIKQASKDSSHALDFEQKDTTGMNLLMRAVRRGSVAIVEMLLEKGVNVNSQTKNGMTALMMACEQKEICLVALLLKFGANSSLYTSDTDQGETALMKAIKKQNKDAVNLMLRTGVNFAPPNCNSISALDTAVERRNNEIETILRSHIDRLVSTFEEKVNETLQDTAQLVDKLFPIQCFPLRESHEFSVKFNCYSNPLVTGEGFLLFIAHTKINDRGVRCRFHGTCPIASVVLNGVTQTPLTREVNFVTSCHPIVSGCNSLVISKHPDYTSKAKLMVCAYRARLLSLV